MAIKGGRPKKNQSDIVRLFARRVREIRRERGISQMKLAVQANIHISFLGRLERGGSSPTLDTVAGIAKALGVGVHELLTECAQEADPLPALRAQIRESVETALQRGDRPALSALAMVISALIRKR